METIINFGEAIKSLDGDKIGGYLVLFSDEKSTDLAGDFFTKDTDFGITDGAKTAIWFNHRKPIKTKDGKSVVVKEKIGEGTLSIDDNGVLVEAVLFNRKQYEKALSAMGWSSGTAAHLIEREKKGTASFVKQWPLGLDASVTPIPCEPRTAVVPLKSLTDDFASDFVIEEDGLKAVAKSAVKMTGAEILQQNIAEQQMNFWRLESALCATAKDIAEAAAASGITGAEIDVAALVRGAVNLFGDKLVELITAQINDFLQSNDDDFYLKSTLLDALIESPRVGMKFADRLDLVLAAVERVTNDAKEIHEMRRAQKAGRKISQARMTKLKEMAAQLSALIAEVEAEPMADNAGKSVDQAEIISLVAAFEIIQAAPNLRR